MDQRTVGLAEVVLGRWQHDAAAIVPDPDSEMVSAQAAARAASQPRGYAPADGRVESARRPGWRASTSFPPRRDGAPQPKRRPSNSAPSPRPPRSPRTNTYTTGQDYVPWRRRDGRASGRGDDRPPLQAPWQPSSASTDPRPPIGSDPRVTFPYRDARLAERTASPPRQRRRMDDRHRDEEWSSAATRGHSGDASGAAADDQWGNNQPGRASAEAAQQDPPWWQDRGVHYNRGDRSWMR